MAKTLRVNGREVEIFPLTMGQLRKGGLEKIREHDKLIDEGKFYDSMLIAVELITNAILRGNKDLTAEEIEDALDLGNYREIWQTVLGVSGLGEGQGQVRETEAMTIAPSTEP